MPSDHQVVSHEEWIAARTAFLAKEKEFTRLRDEMSRQLRELPWEAVGKDYVFEGPHGKQTLAERAKKSAFHNYVMQDPGMPQRTGISTFFKDADGAVFHTYSTYLRGVDILNTAYGLLDFTAKGRDEADGVSSGCGGTMSTRRRDQAWIAP